MPLVVPATPSWGLLIWAFGLHSRTWNQIEATNGACILEADNSAYGDTTPGSAGGHCLLGWSYTGLADTDTLGLLTWGTIQRATWGWLKSRIMEAHGIVWPQLTLASGLYPTGPDFDSLRAQNAELLNDDP